MASKQAENFTLASPAYYRIRVQGWLDKSWSDRLADMAIEVNIQINKIPVAALAGQLKDQTELIGVLNNLYELRLPILSVEILDHNNHEGQA